MAFSFRQACRRRCGLWLGSGCALARQTTRRLDKHHLNHPSFRHEKTMHLADRLLRSFPGVLRSQSERAMAVYRRVSAHELDLSYWALGVHGSEFTRPREPPLAARCRRN
eukprot:5068323-Prymnesium_polylepis.1